MSSLNWDSFIDQIHHEYDEILTYWTKYAFDHSYSNIIVSRKNDNSISPSELKGIVYHARLLYTYAKAYQYTNNDLYLSIANDIFNVIENQFLDNIHGGYYWSIDQNNIIVEGKKQIYGQAFVLYAYSTYAQVNPSHLVISKADYLFRCIETHGFNNGDGSYKEALQRDWGKLEDMRLSTKDVNTPISLNTHLHLLEAYVAYYKVSPNPQVQYQLQILIDCFINHFIGENGNVRMFFQKNWQQIDAPLSYGHDIETSWLLVEAAENINYKLSDCQKLAIRLCYTSLNNTDRDGALLYESTNSEKHWWVQAEALVGFLHAYHLTNDSSFLSAFMNVWNYIQLWIKDPVHGEWFWGRDENNNIIDKEKIGFWKCPYHNSRACLEIIGLLSYHNLTQSSNSINT